VTEPVSRRRFINLVGRAGGAAAMYGTLDAMGLLRGPGAEAAPPAGSGRGTRVVVLGAGIAGLTAAHALGKAGYCRQLGVPLEVLVNDNRGALRSPHRGADRRARRAAAGVASPIARRRANTYCMYLTSER